MVYTFLKNSIKIAIKWLLIHSVSEKDVACSTVIKVYEEEDLALAQWGVTYEIEININKVHCKLETNIFYFWFKIINEGNSLLLRTILKKYWHVFIYSSSSSYELRTVHSRTINHQHPSTAFREKREYQKGTCYIFF